MRVYLAGQNGKYKLLSYFLREREREREREIVMMSGLQRRKI